MLKNRLFKYYVIVASDCIGNLVGQTRKKYCWRCQRPRVFNPYQSDDSDESDDEPLTETEKSKLEDAIDQHQGRANDLQDQVYKLEEKNRMLADLAYARCQRLSVRIQKPPKEGEVDISDQSIQVNEKDLPDKNPEDDAIMID